jgi:nitronate monooxygenase
VFVRAVRAFFDGPIVLAGGISDGHALRAAEALGCDLAYMDTKFIATRESMADPRYKAMLVASSADDILLTTAFTGLQTNMLRPSIEAAGPDPDDLPQRGAIDIGKDVDAYAPTTCGRHPSYRCLGKCKRPPTFFRICDGHVRSARTSAERSA